MEKTFQELCKQYENAVPADIPAAALDAADQACGCRPSTTPSPPAPSRPRPPRRSSPPFSS